MAYITLPKLQDLFLLVTTGLISGEWLATEGKTFPVNEPSSRAVFRDCANLGRQDFIDAIESAEAGTKRFYEETAAQRGAILRKWFALVIANDQDLATILSLENGKTYADAKGEIVYAASFISWFAEEATRSYGDTIPSSYSNATALTYKEPVGVCGIMTPWNFPAAMITSKVAPAFAGGCSVVVKPPSETPFSALALGKLALYAGVPTSCIHVVPTKDRAASMELATTPKVKKLSFTGSIDVGKMLISAAAGTIKRVSMKLGGNAPFIVFDDANLDQAVEAAMACKYRCSGQTCVVRFPTEPPAIADVKTRPRIDEGVTKGPLANSVAVKKIDRHVRDAIRKGAILHDTFGALAAIFAFKTEDEAVNMSNATEYRLAAYLMSKVIGRVFRAARHLECTILGVNTGLISAAESPFGRVQRQCDGKGRKQVRPC
ncbi:Uncharacterized protein HZ326_26025 [Fusarium oxysporum f. sp. albedinis]|nr:Uncharacterized protein HZ326_26025 [Fusarium oxysporum f. sp. albedinis]